MSRPGRGMARGGTAAGGGAGTGAGQGAREPRRDEDQARERPPRLPSPSPRLPSHIISPDLCPATKRSRAKHHDVARPEAKSERGRREESYLISGERSTGTAIFAVSGRDPLHEADVEANINSKDIIGKLTKAIRAVPTTESVRRSGEARGRGWLTSAMSATIRHDLAAGPQVLTRPMTSVENKIPFDQEPDCQSTGTKCCQGPV